MSSSVLITVLSADLEPWRYIEQQGQRRTWAATPQADSIFFLHGRTTGPQRFLMRAGGRVAGSWLSPQANRRYHAAVGRYFVQRPVSLHRDEVRTQVPETYAATGAKTLAALRYLLETQHFDYLLRTNASSYVNVRLLRTYVESLPPSSTIYYGGTAVRVRGVDFASGTGILLSRAAVAHICDDEQWNFEAMDDVAVGLSMKRAGAALAEFPRLDVRDADGLDRLAERDLRSAFLIRCKGRGDRTHDVAAMAEIHKRYAALGLT